MQAGVRATFAYILSRLIGLLVAGLVGLAFVQVVLRYGFRFSLLWVEEVSVMALIWLAWIGIVYLWLVREHIFVDLLPNALPTAGRRWLGLAIEAVALVCGVALVFVSQGTLEMYAGMQLGSLEIDATTKYYPIAFGGAGLAAAALLNLWQAFSGGEGRT